ncbi:hypothetical protein RhiTH_010746 [Rhizoctonia solani]
MVVPTSENEGTYEYDLLNHFSTPPLKDDPSNHIVPLLDQFPIPGIELGYFIVMPLSQFKEPAFYNASKTHDFFKQVFGMSNLFMKSLSILIIKPIRLMPNTGVILNTSDHRRGFGTVLLVWAMLNGSRRRTALEGLQAWVSVKPRPNKTGIAPYDPFVVDVYQLGIMIQNEFIDLKFLSSLINEMTQHDPSERADIGTARSTMKTAFLGLSGSQYRWPLATEKHGPLDRICVLFLGLLEEVKHAIRQILTVLLQRK